MACPLPITPDASQSVRLMHELAALLDPADTVTTDVGQHQMWAAQHLPFREPRRWLTSGGLGTMGFGLPTAIGAAMANAGAGRTICITGDGSLLMNIQEFATLAELGLPVKIILLDNGHLGLVRQQQQLFFSGRFSACEFASAVDFTRIAQAFGISAMTYDSTIPHCLAEFLSTEGPGLLHVRIAAKEKVLPMVAPGAGNLQMIVEDEERLVETSSQRAAIWRYSFAKTQ
jgi:acetolactate synthase-1/2/3 large subunit